MATIIGLKPDEILFCDACEVSVTGSSYGPNGFENQVAVTRDRTVHCMECFKNGGEPVSHEVFVGPAQNIWDLW